MISRNRLLVILGIIGGIALFAFMIYVGQPERKPNPVVPQVAGQKVPDKRFSIDFEKRYDFHLSQSNSEVIVLKNCKILGFTAPHDLDRGQNNMTYSNPYLDFLSWWLVLEKEDGRKAFVPPSAIRVMEEAKTEKSSSSK